MDDRRFDLLVKSLAQGRNRRSLLKGILGLGGAALVGGTLLDEDAGAARRPTPTPTPKPIRCPGKQVPVNGVCTCPASAPNKCGPDCCTSTSDAPYPRPATHSECCDNACCFGTCYGEELCCPYPREYCPSTGECCPADKPYCCAGGCCATPCCSTPAGPVCCAGSTPTCCAGDACVAEGVCCTKADCPGCQDCQNHVCVDDDALCPGGVAGCLECWSSLCQQVNANCTDGNACTADICNPDGSCSNPFDCNGQASCCSDGNACTSDVCNADGSCSNPFDCRLGPGSCCPAGQICGADGRCEQTDCIVDGVNYPTPCINGCPTCIGPPGNPSCGCAASGGMCCSSNEECVEALGTGNCVYVSFGPCQRVCVIPANPS